MDAPIMSKNRHPNYGSKLNVFINAEYENFICEDLLFSQKNSHICNKHNKKLNKCPENVLESPYQRERHWTR